MSGLRQTVVVASHAVLSPWLAGLIGAFVVAMTMVGDVARVLRRSVDVAERLDAARAHLVADAAVLAAFAHPAAPATSMLGGTRATVCADGDVVAVECRLPDGDTHRFVGRVLPGAPPPALSRGFTSSVTRPRVSSAPSAPLEALPVLDPEALATATRGDATTLLRRDPGVALHCWKAGTDAEDFVLADGGNGVDLMTAGELLLVPGHLWIEASREPLVLRADRDVVIVVQGNLYLGRSVRVVGSGRVVFATQIPNGTRAFVDCDANGRWSDRDLLLAGAPDAGPIEGAGSVFFGRAGATQPIECAPAIVVAGAAHVFVTTTVAGPLVLGHGATALRAGAELVPAGEWHFHPERDGVPGFVTAGSPRPSLLQRDAAPRGNTKSATMREQPLYLSAPPR